MEDNSMLLQWLLVGLVSILILFFIVKMAVSSAMETHNKHARTRTRLLVKKMLKEGFTRNEIIEAMNDDEADFWNKID